MGTTTPSSWDEAQVLGPLLGEYAQRLSALNRDLTSFLLVTRTIHERTAQAAWLLDSFEVIRKPLGQVLSRSSQFVEHTNLEPLVRDVMILRLADLESQLHHSEGLIRFLRMYIKSSRVEQDVTPLRMAAGQPLSKNGSTPPR